MNWKLFRRAPKPVDLRAEMMAAIREAAQESCLFKGTTLANGLRCIRTFESVNGIAFDPLNQWHRDTVRGMGVHEGVFRRVRLSLASRA